MIETEPVNGLTTATTNGDSDSKVTLSPSYPNHEIHVSKIGYEGASSNSGEIQISIFDHQSNSQQKTPTTIFTNTFSPENVYKQNGRNPGVPSRPLPPSSSTSNQSSDPSTSDFSPNSIDSYPNCQIPTTSKVSSILTRSRKKSEEGKKVNLDTVRGRGVGGTHNSAKHRKSHGIPVGIAVGWQRHVVTSGGLGSFNTTVTTSKHHHNHSTQLRSAVASTAMSSPPLKSIKRSLNSHKIKTDDSVKHREDPGRGHRPVNNNSEHGGIVILPPSSVGKYRGTSSDIGTVTNGALKTIPDYTSSSDMNGDDGVVGAGVDSRSRLIPGSTNSSSINVGSGNTPGYLNSPYEMSSYYHGGSDWSSPLVPNSSPQSSYNAMMAAYLQQLSLHPGQLNYGYGSSGTGPGSPYLYNAYSPEQVHHQYEQLLLQNTGIELLRAHRTSTPLPNLVNGRVSIPSPSPNSPYAGSPLTGSDIYHHHHHQHQHHPMSLISSATLSPRSLASSTPSPITTYDSQQHSYHLLNRKCITPNPQPSLKTWPLLSSPFSPSLVLGKDHWRDTIRGGDQSIAEPMSLVTHRRKPSTMSPVAEDELEDDPGNEKDEKTSLRPKSIHELTASQPENKKLVDFSRLESLIEKRGEASVRLLTHAPPLPIPPVVNNNNNNKSASVIFKCEDHHQPSHHRRHPRHSSSMNKKLIGTKMKREKVAWNDVRASPRDCCDGPGMSVPESLTNLPTLITCDHVDNQLSSTSITRRPSESDNDIVSSNNFAKDKYFLPIEPNRGDQDHPDEKSSNSSSVDVALGSQSMAIGERKRKSCDTLCNTKSSRGKFSNTSIQHVLPPTKILLVPPAGINLQALDSTKNNSYTSDNNKKDCDSESITNCSKLICGGRRPSNGLEKFPRGGGGCGSTPTPLPPPVSGVVVNNNSGNSFPRIVISPGENHLSLLATVAQEIGPYLNMNPSPSSRRFENLDNLIQIEGEDGFVRRLSNASTVSSLRSISPILLAATSIKVSEIESTVKELTENPVKSLDQPIVPITSESLILDPPAGDIIPESPPVESGIFQLKIPHVIPRTMVQEKPGKGIRKTRKSPKLNKEKIQKSSKESKPRRKRVPKTEISIAKLPKKVDKVKNTGKTEPKKHRVKKTGRQLEKISSSATVECNMGKFESPKLGSFQFLDSSAPKTQESIYDFEVEPPLLETFKHFTSSDKSTKKPKVRDPKKRLTLRPPIKSSSWSPVLTNSMDLNSESSSLSKSPKKSNANKRPRPSSASKLPSHTPKKSKMKESKSKNSGNFSTPEKLNGTSSLLENAKPLSLEPFLSTVPATFFNSDSNHESLSNDSSNSTWTANPIHAVTAVKISPTEEPICLQTDKVPSLKSLKWKNPKRNLRSEEAKNEAIILDVNSQPFSLKRTKGATLLNHQNHHHHIKPCLKAEPIVRLEKVEPIPESEEEELLDIPEGSGSIVNLPKAPSHGISGDADGGTKSSERLKIRKPSIDMNIFSRRVKSASEEERERKDEVKEAEEEWNENVVIGSVEEMIDEMRVLTEIQGLFYTGKLNALHPPDVYGVTLDNERGAPPHIIFSAEEVLEKCIREAKPWAPSQLPHGLRICAYWSPMYSGLYPGRVSTDYDLHSDLVPVEFDDGDTGVIKICEIRLLSPNHPVREYDPNPLQTLEKKHRKRRHSSVTGTQNICTGDHDEDDCGESYCAKIAKIQDDTDEDDYSTPNNYKYWTWSGLGFKLPKTKQNRHKEFFHGIQRGEEIINVGDSAIFISDQQNRRPFLGRIEKFWEKKGLKSVTVRWFYHPEEAKTGRKAPTLKFPGALFESPHIDDNDVQTIAKKCEVLPFQEFKKKYGHLLNTKSARSHKPAALKGIYYIAGYYDPFTCSLKLKDLK